MTGNMAMSSAFFVLVMMMIHQCLSVAMTRFTLSEPPNVDAMNLHYDFLASNSGQVNRTETVFGIKSLAQCSLMCLVNTNFKCVTFAYESKERSCNMFSMLTSGNRIFKKTFKKIPDCPADFVYLKDYNKCYLLTRVKYNWSDARMKCNEINSHPLIVDDYKEYKALEYFISLSAAYFKWIWISGIMIPPKTWVWKPYQMKDGREPYLPINFYQWGKYEPSSNPNEYCLGLSSLSYYTGVCRYPNWVLCEVDV